MTIETNVDQQVSEDPLLTEARSIEAQAAEPAPEPQEDPTGDEPAASEDDQPEGEQPPKRKPSAQERIDEVTRARRTAEREAEYWRNEALRSREPQPTQPQQASQEDAEPNSENYAYGEGDASFIRDLARYETRREFAEQARQQQARAAAQATEQTWTQRQQDFAKTAPDYFEALESDWPCSETMADAIRTSDDGAAVAYHLAKNPDDAHRLAGLNPLAQVREIGRLEARLSASRAPETSPAIKLVSDAPSPTPALRGNGGKFKPAADTSDFSAFEKTYGA